jgi:hypothetical protein
VVGITEVLTHIRAIYGVYGAKKVSAAGTTDVLV